MKHITLDHFIGERIQENRELFTKEDFTYMNQNKECVKKIYLIGFKNAKECYEQKKFR